MKLAINDKELLGLLNSEAKLNALEDGGVHNWSWYDESLNDYEELDENILERYEGYKPEKKLKYNQNDKVYYNNTESLFVAYLNEEYAVIVVSAMPDFENYDVSNHCWGCQVGDSDNKLQCNCDELLELLDGLEENTEPTFIPLIVRTTQLFDSPIIVSKHEKELQAIAEEKVKILEKTKELMLKNIELEAQLKEKQAKIDALNELNKF